MNEEQDQAQLMQDEMDMQEIEQQQRDKYKEKCAQQDYIEK